MPSCQLMLETVAARANWSYSPCSNHISPENVAIIHDPKFIFATFLKIFFQESDKVTVNLFFKKT